MYIIPRVFVLCSPRTVQFHYELILRVGLPSYEFNPDRHDIDLTVLGANNNEIVPMTRLNTKTLLDEPLITSLSLVVYRLVEMPQLGSIVVSHSGHHRCWVYAYDFTVINLSTNREQYYTLNQYIGCINKTMHMTEVQGPNEVHYPIDDVPCPRWILEDIFIVMFVVTNAILALNTFLPLSCNYKSDLTSMAFSIVFGLCVSTFVAWYLHYNMHWDQDRRDFFNDYTKSKYIPNETVQRILILLLGALNGAYAIYVTIGDKNWQRALIYTLVSSNSFTWVFGIITIARQFDLVLSLVKLGFTVRGTKSVIVGSDYYITNEYKHSHYSSQSSQLLGPDGIDTASRNDDEGSSSMSMASRINRGIGTRSSVKSYGFDLTNKMTSAMSKASSSNMMSASTIIASMRSPMEPAPMRETISESKHSSAVKHHSSVGSVAGGGAGKNVTLAHNSMSVISAKSHISTGSHTSIIDKKLAAGNSGNTAATKTAPNPIGIFLANKNTDNRTKKET